jgi:uncharacterized protein YggT (Ycf19 family)
MTYRTDTEVVEPAPAYHTTRVTSYSQGPMAILEKVVLLIFSLIELVIVLRIVLLLLAARQGNDIVQFVYSVSDIFVAPFRGILRIDEIQAGIAALDFGAVVALIGWLIIEVVVIAIVRLFRPSATVALGRNRRTMAITTTSMISQPISATTAPKSNAATPAWISSMRRMPRKGATKMSLTP